MGSSSPNKGENKKMFETICHHLSDTPGGHEANLGVNLPMLG